MLGYVPEVKIGGTAYAQTSPILIYLSKQGKMDKLNELEELKSGMMLETVTEVFLGQGRNFIISGIIEASDVPFKLYGIIRFMSRINMTDYGGSR